MTLPVRRRVCIDISEDQYAIITKYIPRNSRQAVFEPIIEEVCKQLKTSPQKFVSRAITKQVKLWVDKEEK